MKKLKYLLIGALLLLVACKPKKLSYRDPFYFSDKQTHGVQIATIATTDTTNRTGDWKTDVYSTGTMVLNNSTQSLYFRMMPYKTVWSVKMTPDSIIHLNLQNLIKLNDSTFKIKSTK